MSKIESYPLADLISDNKEAFFEELNSVINPTFKGLQSPEKYEKLIAMFNSSLQRMPFPRQARLAAASIEHLRNKKSLLLSAEMGTGKTQMALTIALDKQHKVNFIMCPPHLVSKWADEIRTVYRDNIVKYKIVIVTRWTDLVPYTKRNLRKEGVKYFFIVSRETCKLSYRREQVYHKSYKYVIKEETLDGELLQVNTKIAVAKCPRCGSTLEESLNDIPCFTAIPYRCPAVETDSEGNDIAGTECGEVLRQPDRNQSEGMRTRISVAEYIKKQWPKGSIDLLIPDEIHEYKGGDTGQGNALAMMVSRAKRVVGLTGTLLNGYASSLFYILYRLNPSLMKHMLNLDYNQVKHFVEIYGAHEETVEATETNHEGIVTRMGKRIALKEKPKISPYLLSLLLDFTIFLRLDEIKMDELSLPDYEEIVDLVPMNEEFKKEFNSYIGEVSSKIRKDKRYLGVLASDSISVPDLPFNYHSAHGEIEYIPPVIRNENDRENPEQKLLPLTNKEQRLIELVGSELEQNRPCLVFIHFSNKGVGDDARRILAEKYSGKKVEFLKPSIPAKKRQKWIENNPCDVLICNPELVKTGLDLLQFPTIIFYETTYNVFTLKQASRRSWRIGQREDVKVYFMAYEDSPQHIALRLIGSKVNAANSLEGRLSGDDDLSSMGDDDDNIQLALAKAILRGDKVSGNIEMNKITNFGEREWDAFELYYRAYLADNEIVLPDVDDTNIFDEYEDVRGIADSDGDYGFNMGDEVYYNGEKVVFERSPANSQLFVAYGFGLRTFLNDHTKNEFTKTPSLTNTAPSMLDAFQPALFATDNDGQISDEKIVIYKRVKKGKRYVEQRLEVTKHDIDIMVGEEEANSVQLSLF